MALNIRKFALLVIDDFDQIVDRYNLDYVESPQNLGFEMEFTTLEQRLTTYFTSAKEKRIDTNLTIVFADGYVYERYNALARFIQKYMNSRIVFEYNDTTVVKMWEGKVRKLTKTEKTEYGALKCGLVFAPGTPKYIYKDNTIRIQYSSTGKKYPLKYPYSYGSKVVSNNEIFNTYFDEIPLRIWVYGSISNPVISLLDETDTVYSSVKFNDLTLVDGEHVIVDAINKQVLLYRNNAYQDAYDYLDLGASFDKFLYAEENTTSRLSINLTANDTGYLRGSYRQYTL